MKILYIIPAFSHIFGGAVTVAAEAAKKLVERGHEVVVLTSDARDKTSRIKKEFEIVDGVKVYYMKNFTMMTVKLLDYVFITPEMSHFLKEYIQEFDIVHLHSYRTYQNIIAYKYARGHKVPYIIQPHGSVPRNIPPSTLKMLLKTLFDYAWGYRILRDAARVLALSRDEAGIILRMGISKEKIVIIPNGIDLSRYKPVAKGRFRSKYGIDDNIKIVTYIGRISVEKGLDFLLKAFTKLLKISKESVVLAIIGPDMGYLRNVVKLVKQLGLKDKVLIIGPLPHSEELFSVYVDSDVIVIPSKSEAFPVTALEAFVYGKPVISTRVGALKDVIIDGVTGFLVNYDDVDELARKMYMLINDDQLATNMGKEAQRLAKHRFSLDNIVKEIEEVYYSIAQD